jgi:hypothetical protein
MTSPWLVDAPKMPAPRNCRACGAALPADVRWCLRCYAPATEFAPRARLHPDGVAGTPRPTELTSRTKASATTWGPAGRIAVTVVLGLVTLQNVVMMTTNGLGFALIWGLTVFLGWTVFVVIALRQVWKAVPVDDAFVPPKFRVKDVWRAGVAPAEGDAPRLTNAMIVWRIVVGIALLAAFVAFRTGPNAVKAAVMATAAVVGLYAFIRGFWAR